MRLLVLSDLHANIDALEDCLAGAPAHDLIVNLGDVVGYNASPNEVCDRVRAMGGLIVRGNRQPRFSARADQSVQEFNPVAAISAHWTKNSLEADHLEWLKALPAGPLRRDGLPSSQSLSVSSFTALTKMSTC